MRRRRAVMCRNMSSRPSCAASTRGVRPVWLTARGSPPQMSTRKSYMSGWSCITAMCSAVLPPLSRSLLGCSGWVGKGGGGGTHHKWCCEQECGVCNVGVWQVAASKKSGVL